MYQAGPAEQFYSDFEKNLAAGDKRWTEWWGALHAGPFNYLCMDDCLHTTCNCGKSPQPQPPAV